MKIRGEITPPGDKSISHRAFMFGAIANGTTVIANALPSEDVISTRNALSMLGANIRAQGERWLVSGGNLKEPMGVIDAGNSGTTTRVMSGLLAGINGTCTITGDASLIMRPMGRIIKPLEMMGARFMARSDNFLPMSIRGGQLKAIDYTLDVASAQVKSAILLAGLNAEGITSVSEPSLSRDHTERMLQYFGARISVSQERISIEGGQRLEGRSVNVPGDPSSAAFPAVWAAATPGSEVTIRNICLNPTRIGFIEPLRRMGADIEIINARDEAGEPVGDILVRGTTLQGTTIEGDEIPKLIDEIPILTIAACLAEGQTTIKDAHELRIKETDRIEAMTAGLKNLGITIQDREDGMVINGPFRPHDGHITTHGDHRIAMAFHILAKATDIVVDIDNPECVNVSFPGFFEMMESFK